jgi:hypothetical protein
MLYPNITMPVRYMAPPAALTQYIGMSFMVVSTKSGNCSRPVSSNARHIRPWVSPAL